MSILEEPPAAERPRDGTYRRFHAPGGALAEEGPMVRGRRHGTFRSFDVEGRLLREVAYDSGRPHGLERGFHPDGTRAHEGAHAAGRPAGTWSAWHADGELASRRNHGADGRLHGERLERRVDGLEERRVTYRYGVRDGELVAVHPGGAIAERAGYVEGRLHGALVRNAPDGSPRERSTWRHGHLDGARSWWDARGVEHVEAWERGVPAELAQDDARLAALASALPLDPTEAGAHLVAAGADAGPLLVCLLRRGHLRLDHAAPVLELVEGAEALLDGAELVELLRRSEPPARGFSPIVPGWLYALDRLALEVFRRDPEPLRAAWRDLAAPFRDGLGLVLARAGERVEDLDLGETLLARFEGGASVSSTFWPTAEGVREVRLREPGGAMTEHWWRLLERVVPSVERWCAERLRRELASGRRFQLEELLDGLPAASEEQLAEIFRGAMDRERAPAVERAVARLRDGSAAALARLVRRIPPDERPWPLVALAILRAADAGEVPEDLAESLRLPSWASLDVGWVEERVASLPPAEQHDAAALDEAVRLAERTLPLYGTLELAGRALAALSPSARSAAIARQEYLVPLLPLADSAAREELLARLHPLSGNEGLTLGQLPAGELEWLLSRAPAFSRGIVIVLARALELGASIDPAHDRHLERVLLDDEHDAYVWPFLRKAIHHLPSERGEALVRKALRARKRAPVLRALELFGSHPTPQVVREAMHALLRVEASLAASERHVVAAALGQLPEGERAQWVEWLLRRGAGAGAATLLAASLGEAAYAELSERLRSEGVAVARELDELDRLAALVRKAADKSKKKDDEEIYLLRRVARGGEALRRIGGLAPGVGAERWPHRRGRPMAHVVTLDLAAMPELARRFPGQRALSLFVAEPRHNEARHPGNDCTALLASDEAQLAAPAAPPPGVELLDEESYEVVSTRAPRKAWARSSELRGRLHAVGARVLGEPTWVQDPAHRGPLVMQLDASFAPLGLGDGGVLYVFEDTAFWQSH